MWELCHLYFEDAGNHQTGQVRIFCWCTDLMEPYQKQIFFYKVGGVGGGAEETFTFEKLSNITLQYQVSETQKPNFNYAEQHHWPLNLFRRWKNLDTSW